MTGKQDNLRSQIQAYRKLRPQYERLTDALEEILKRAAKQFAPDAIVQVRTKAVSSFAEKAIRKATEYKDPVHEFTDLCGGRIILNSPSEVQRLCKFIREKFTIDDANSQDVRERLRTSEFGYLSVHYIVTPTVDEILGVRIPKSLKDKKAEIQVRTLLQHMWASTLHDRMYKTRVNVPEHWKRESARLAALLESGDQSFERMTQAIDSYDTHFGALMSRDMIKREIKTLNAICSNEPDKDLIPIHALKLARLYELVGDYDSIIKALRRRFQRIDPTAKSCVDVELGNAECRKHQESPRSPAFLRGQKRLRRVAKPVATGRPVTEKTVVRSPDAPVNRLRARSLALLAESYKSGKGQTKQIRDLIYEAYLLESQSPYYLSSFLEHEIISRKDPGLVVMMRPAIEAALDTCRGHVQAGIELPYAHFTMGRLWLLLNRPYRSLSAYMKGIDLCLSGQATVPAETFVRESDTLHSMYEGVEHPESHGWVHTLLRLAATLYEPSRYIIPAAESVRRIKKFKTPVLIVGGGASMMDSETADRYRILLTKGLDGFAGTVISGGTQAGIPGLVGEVLASLRKRNAADYDLISYIPRNKLPSDARLDKKNYDRILRIPGRGFSAGQPLQNWVDIVAAGIDPKDVRLLGINGGRIAAFEFRLALALGAKVGLIESAGRESSELPFDEDWRDHRRLLVLPNDAMTVRAFTHWQMAATLWDPDTTVKSAILAHEAYHQVNITPWGELSEDMKWSNLHQIMYMKVILNSVGYSIEPAVAGDIFSPLFTMQQIETMAEMEHGRWIEERLSSGWRYGKTKDVVNKINPSLVPWDRLVESERKKDRDAVVNFPKILAVVGFRICELKKK